VADVIANCVSGTRKSVSGEWELTYDKTLRDMLAGGSSVSKQPAYRLRSCSSRSPFLWIFHHLKLLASPVLPAVGISDQEHQDIISRLEATELEGAVGRG
jgi:hypothetical protein